MSQRAARSAVSRARLVVPPARDLLLGALVAAVAAGGILTGDVDEGPVALTLPVALVTAAAVAGRRAAPPAPLVAVLATALAGTLQAWVSGVSPGTLWALVSDLLLTYTVAVECAESVATAGLVVAVGGEWWQEWLDHGTDYPFIALIFGGVWLLGRGTRSWRERATLAEAHQRDLARLAVAEERASIARELHDVVAHALSVVAVQADAAEAALAKDPARAAAPLRAIRGSASEALDDMRTLLHLLRRDEDDPAVAEPGSAPGSAPDSAPGPPRPARGLGDVPALVEQMVAAGLPVHASLGPVPDLPPGTQLAVYRIVQEALTNVLKHAGPAPTAVRVTGEGDGVRVVVRNDPGPRGEGGPGAHRDGAGRRRDGTGHGLVGVGERVRAAGGTCTAGPTPDGGFEVSVALAARPQAGAAVDAP